MEASVPCLTWYSDARLPLAALPMLGTGLDCTLSPNSRDWPDSAIPPGSATVCLWEPDSVKEYSSSCSQPVGSLC